MSAGSLRILLVDDDPIGAELTAGVIADLGVAAGIVQVDDGEKALDYLFRRGCFAGRDTPDPDVILLDLKMPKLDGHEVLRQIRAEPALKAARVVMLTSSDQERDVLSSHDLGADAFVLKTVSIHELALRLRGLDGVWQRRDPAAGPAP